MNAIKCDRCGDFDVPKTKKWEINENISWDNKSKRDLCKVCIEDFEIWWKRE